MFHLGPQKEELLEVENELLAYLRDQTREWNITNKTVTEVNTLIQSWLNNKERNDSLPYKFGTYVAIKDPNRPDCILLEYRK